MTIKDLAAQTGYSVGTVSRVLNNQPHVSDLAREVILRAAEESGFQLNTNAKELKQQHGNSILVVVKGRTNDLFADLIEVIQTNLIQTSYPLILDYIDETDNEVRRAVQLSREKKPLGILFLGGNRDHFLEDFHQISLPCVLVTNDATDLPFPNLSSVACDDMQASRMVIRDLVKFGHRKIVVIGGNREKSDTTRLRYEGCLSAFREHGIPFDPELDYETTRFSFEDGYRAAKSQLQRNSGFTAVFAMADTMAIGAIRALQDSGKRVPEDISGVGFDGRTIGEYTIPRLSTVEQPVALLAEQSLNLLRRNIEDNTTANYENVPVSLLWKESVRKIG